MDKIRSRLGDYSFYETTKILSEAGVIDGSIKANLDKYREKRNKVMHELLDQIETPNFEKDLCDVCNMGRSIINSAEFMRMSDVVDGLEKKSTEGVNGVGVDKPKGQGAGEKPI